MDQRVREFIERVADNVVGLDVALFFQANPGTFDTAAGLSLRLHRSGEEIQPALDRLVNASVLEAFTRGEEHYQVYSLCHDAKAWRLLCLVAEVYLNDPEARKEIVRMLVRQQMESKQPEQPPGQTGE